MACGGGGACGSRAHSQALVFWRARGQTNGQAHGGAARTVVLGGDTRPACPAPLFLWNKQAASHDSLDKVPTRCRPKTCGTSHPESENQGFAQLPFVC